MKFALRFRLLRVVRCFWTMIVSGLNMGSIFSLIISWYVRSMGRSGSKRGKM